MADKGKSGVVIAIRKRGPAKRSGSPQKAAARTDEGIPGLDRRMNETAAQATSRTLRTLLPDDLNLGWAQSCLLSDAELNSAAIAAVGAGRERDEIRASLLSPSTPPARKLRVIADIVKVRLKESDENDELLEYTPACVREDLEEIDAEPARPGAFGAKQATRFAKRLSDLVRVTDVDQLANALVRAMFPETTVLSDRSYICDAVRIAAKVVVRARRLGGYVDVEALARSFILDVCRCAPDLGERLHRHNRLFVTAIDASSQRGRPKDGRRTMKASDAVDALLGALGMRVTREALRSDRRRKKGGALLAP